MLFIFLAVFGELYILIFERIASGSHVFQYIGLIFYDFMYYLWYIRIAFNFIEYLLSIVHQD